MNKIAKRIKIQYYWIKANHVLNKMDKYERHTDEYKKWYDVYYKTMNYIVLLENM